MFVRFRRWLGWGYRDEHLAWLARRAVAADPLLPDLTRMSITCTRGVIRLTGRVPHAQDRHRVEAVIHVTLQTAGVPYKRIRNQLYIP